ncbi:MerR family transcriptional regulator [Nocardia callitridis]|uniref:HTH merR-type domain-containing protein n=1 Tax=Nocardia callitridis TaxID=648753 RepID=A0ABP9KHK5_9NOCA
MAGVEYTIDQLAREAGTTVRSLRVYHERGVLPPPQVKGRTGFYSAEHLNRVRTISRLLDRGIKLNGIKELLNAFGRGDNLGDLLNEPDGRSAESGTAAGSDVPAEPAESETVAATELAERYRDVPDGFARVVGAGLYQPVDAQTYRVADPGSLRVVEQLLIIGVDLADSLGELERLRADADRIAHRFIDLFHRGAWSKFQASARDSTDLAELAAGVAVLREVAGAAEGMLVNRSVARQLDQDDELAAALSGE